MTDQSPGSTGIGLVPRPNARTEPLTKRLQRIGNRFVIGLLRSPLHRLASRSLLLITFRGRRSGRLYTIPVMYAEHDRTLTIFVGHAERKTWWRNLGDGAAVDVRLRSRSLRGEATVVNDAEAAEIYVNRYPRACKMVGNASTFVRITKLEPRWMVGR